MLSDVELIDLCRSIAEEAHYGQFRKFGDDKGKPYIVHPERIAKTFYYSSILASIAWLHDVIEDTYITARELLNSGVPPELVDAVVSLSKVDGENYKDFILRIKHNDWASAVKRADIKDNMVSLKEGSLKDKYRLALYVLSH